MPVEGVRPDPDSLLEQANAEETRRKRGRLSIFLGYAAGVGKTYAMLEAAHQRKADGVDVVIGYVETHKRAETEELRVGLEAIPPRQVEYRGVSLTEMDLDAILARRPQLVLVDELAHSNSPSFRHPKRYQDVEEILAAGISVLTTLNIQHVESLNDIVAQITGVQVKETLPDRILNEADEIKLVDLPPEELQQRLREGKVYVAGQAERALEKFFRLGNLNALRELALRQTAERVGEQMRSYMETHAIAGPWQAEERVLVCLSATPSSERVVRSARRLADELHADLLAVYIETSNHYRLSDQTQQLLVESMRLAEELGAVTATLPGDSVAAGILAFAAKNNITKIVVGKTMRPVWLERLRGSLVDYLIRHSGNVDIYVVSGLQDMPLSKQIELGPGAVLLHFLNAAALTVLVTVLGVAVRTSIDPINLVMLYLLAILFAALRWGRGPSIFASVLGVLLFDFFLVVPYHTFAVADVQYVFTFAVLFTVGVLTSGLATRARDQAASALRRTLITTELYNFTRDLATATDLDGVLAQINKYIVQTLNSQMAIFLVEGQSLALQPSVSSFIPGVEEEGTAYWAFQHGEAAGKGTDTLSGGRARYVPLRTAKNILGVLGLLPSDPETQDDEQDRLLDAICTQAAVAIERLQFEEKARRVEVMAETEKLQTALLNSISHDLRTPLVSITGAITALQENDHIAEAARKELLATARGEAHRLNRLVGNLLDMTRLEGGVIKPLSQSIDVSEIVEVALQEYRERLAGRKVSLDLVKGLPFVHVDPVLVGRAVGNVLENALKYSPPGSPIDIRASARQDWIDLEIADLGPGIPEGELDRVFDKFHRVDRANQLGGTGLGLSISKGLVEANGGRLKISNRPAGGLRVIISLRESTQSRGKD